MHITYSSPTEEMTRRCVRPLKTGAGCTYGFLSTPQLIQGVAAHFRDNMLFPGCVAGQRPYNLGGHTPGAERLSGGKHSPGTPPGSTRAKESQCPLPTACCLVLVLLAWSLRVLFSGWLEILFLPSECSCMMRLFCTSIKNTPTMASGGTEGPVPGALKALPTLRGQAL